jgi:hypothetical protein
MFVMMWPTNGLKFEGPGLVPKLITVHCAL